MFSFKTSIVIMLMFLFNQCVGANQPTTVKRELIQLSMKMTAPFSVKHGWTFTVNGNGSARLTIDTFPSPTIRTFDVSARQMIQLQQIVDEQHFFDLGIEYGNKMPDGDKRILSIKRGQQTKTVTLNIIGPTSPKLSEAKRALKVWRVARSWFKDADAKDLQIYDKQVLDTK